jgi:hypothetical protein
VGTQGKEAGNPVEVIFVFDVSNKRNEEMIFGIWVLTVLGRAARLADALKLAGVKQP